MTNNQSKELTEFYIAYNGWLEAGAPDRKPFYRDCGLCTNLLVYSRSIGLNYYYYDILNEMEQQFKDAGFDPLYPFGGENVYDICSLSYTSYLNPERIKWVKEHICNFYENNV